MKSRQDWHSLPFVTAPLHLWQKCFGSIIELFLDLFKALSEKQLKQDGNFIVPILKCD